MSTCWRFCSMVADHVQAGRLGQPADLVQGIVMIVTVIGENDPDQDGSFLTPQTLGAF